MESIFFSKNLKILRNSKGLTQLDIANIIDANKALIANYESARNFPPVETLIKLADYFSVSIDGLLRTDMAVNGVNEPAAKYGATIKQTNNGGNGNHNTIIHTESDWVGMEQRVKDLEANIESQKQTIAAKDELIAVLKQNYNK